MKNWFLLTIITSFLITACNIKHADTKLVASEMKNMELKRITPTQISSFANDWGMDIVTYLDKNNGSSAAIDTLQKSFAVKINKLNINSLNGTNMDPKEKEVYEAYKYAVENNQTIEPNLQKLNGGEIQLFTSPAKSSKTDFWRIEFTKKEIIKKVSVKDIKKKVTE